MTTDIPFDITAPIPEGTTVLEASAGTGKTFAIVGLAARCIADGVPISTLLLVTFSRSATAELRERTRARVHDLVVALTDPAAAADSADLLTRHLASGSPDDVARRRENLARALSDFDASTIATTHTFCNRMLEALGFLGERDVVQQIIEDADDLVEQAARDLYLAGYRHSDAPQIGFAAAVGIAKDAVRHQGLALAPDAAELTTDTAGSGATEAGIIAARHRVAFATRIREIVAERKRTARIRTYDDLQMILYGIVTDPVVGDEACERIRRVFDLVLIDEFQDTDPFQWAIVRRCFHGHRTLVLVGDPKQSIYGFRGADVLSYLQAVESADGKRVLTENWRSEGDLVHGLATLYGGAALGDQSIVVYPVSAAHPGSSLRRPDSTPVAPVRLRAFTRGSFARRGASGFAGVGDIRAAVIDDVAADIAGLLASQTSIQVAGDQRPVQPGDIAILVRFNRTIGQLQQALARLGVASVIGTGTSVFHTDAAHAWLAVIRAIEQPARGDRVRLAALSPLVGWTAEQLDQQSERELAGLATDLHDLRRVFDEGGFAAMAQRLMARHGVAARVLAGKDGERALTDLIQIASLCNAHVMETDAGLGGVGEWLGECVANTRTWQRSQDQTRRLDRDTQVVQIMTVHASKGLQFPIVYLPFGWDAAGPPGRETFTFHGDDGVRRLDVGGEGAPGVNQRVGQSEQEIAGEDLRLLYVALTRAHSQVVMWWAPSYDSRRSALHRMLFGRSPDSAVVPPSADVPSDEQCLAVLESIASRSPFVAVEKAGAAAVSRWDGPAADVMTDDLSAATFTRVIDQEWRRTSYSAIVAGAAHQTISVETPTRPALTESSSEPEAGLLDDEPAAGDAALSELPGDTGPDENRSGTKSLMNGMPFGAAFGTLVHEVLEHVDTDAADITEHVADLCREAMRYRALDVDVVDLTRALVGVLTTPLSFGDLWHIPTRDRLAEMDFEFPLATDGTAATPSSIADLVDKHLDDDDPLRAYPDRLRELPRRALRGFLTGSIDSVLRTAENRFVVVDYKTNRLRPGPLVAEDFTRDEMAQEMIAAHYPLQALLYSVALHRYLRWRIPGYQAARHLGPVQYHFVRGMVGPNSPSGCGVLEWSIPPVLVEELSDHLAGSASGTQR